MKIQIAKIKNVPSHHVSVVIFKGSIIFKVVSFLK